MTTNKMFHWGRGLELRLAREELGFSMDEFANELGYARRTIQRWEGDIDPIPADLWDRLPELQEKFRAYIDQFVQDVMAAAERSAPTIIVPARHMRERIAAAEAVATLQEQGLTSRLVTAAGAKAIATYGYEDPLRS